MYTTQFKRTYMRKPKKKSKMTFIANTMYSRETVVQTKRVTCLFPGEDINLRKQGFLFNPGYKLM